MAAVTSLNSVFNTSTGAHNVTATPAVDDLIVVAVQASRTADDTTGTVTDDNSDGNGTYTFVGRFWDAAVDRWVAFYVRDALVGSASSTTFTATPSGSIVGGGLQVFKVTGMSKTGSAAVRQFNGNGNGSSGVAMLATMSSAVLTGNPVLFLGSNQTSPAGMDPQTSPAYTERVDTGYSNPTTGVFTQTIDSGETGTAIETPDTSASIWAAIAVELDASAAATMGSGHGRVRLRSTTSARAQVPATGRLRLRATATARAQIAAHGRIRIRSTAVGGPPPQSAAAQGRIKLRSTAQGRAVIPARGRVRLRSTARGRAQVAAHGRIRLRGTAFGSTPPQTAAGSGRIRLRGTAQGRPIGSARGTIRLRSTAQGRGQVAAHGRIKLRSRAAGFAGAVNAPPSVGRIRLRSTARGRAQVAAHGRLRLRSSAVSRAQVAARGRIKLHSTAQGVRVLLAAAHGRLRLRSASVGSPLFGPLGEPVCDPLAVLASIEGQAAQVSADGTARIVVVQGEAEVSCS